MLRFLFKKDPSHTSRAGKGRHKLSNLRVRLVLLVLLAVLPALGLTLVTGLERRRLAVEGVKSEAIRLTRIAASNEEAQIEGARQLLVALANSPEVFAEAPGVCSAFLANIKNYYPKYATISVARPDGEIYCSSLPFEQPVNIGDRAYFKQILQNRDFVIGDYTMGRLSKKGILPFAYPAVDKSGQVRAVLVTAVDLDYLHDIARGFNLPERSAMRVMDSKGTILSRYPDPGVWVGKSLPEDQLFQIMVDSPGEGVAEIPGVDGVHRLYAFSPIRGTENSRLFVSVGIPTEVAYAEVNRSLIRDITALLFVAILALVAAWYTGDLFILRQVNMLIAATRRLAAGDLDARSGLPYDKGEIGELASAFDHMADTLKEREGQLKRSNLELQDFAYITSHDLQEPLRKIQAFGERLLTKHGQSLNQEGQEYAGRMIKDAARMQAMINDLLAYSRVSTRAQPFNPISLSSAAGEAVSDLHARLEETGGKVEIGNLPVIEGDINQLRQLFQNLVGNALKFHKPDQPPLVRIYCNEPEGDKRAHPGRRSPFSSPSTPTNRVEIVIEDNGIGFDEKYLDRIFEPFQRLHGRGVYEGSGIGLSICRKIVEHHGGKITARSKPGEGAAFIVTLPVKQPAKRPDANPAQSWVRPDQMPGSEASDMHHPSKEEGVL